MSTVYNGMKIIRNGGSKPGALGGFFTFGGKEIFGISNNHVLANLDRCTMGDKICMSGSEIVIGSLQCWIELTSHVNYLDVALFKLAPDTIPYWRMPPNHRTVPGKIRLAQEGEKVYMITNNGSTKEGIINQLFIDVEHQVDLLGYNYTFTGLTEVKTLSGSPFSIPGESGSVVFSENDDVLGILIGTNKSNDSKSYYVPFVHDELGICAVYPNIQVWNPYMNIT